jgi:hypothetical protein
MEIVHQDENHIKNKVLHHNDGVELESSQPCQDISFEGD